MDDLTGVTPQNDAKPHWFSANSDKAWGEKFFLIYTPIWILQIVVATLLGWSKSLGDLGLLIQSCLVTIPMFLVPLIIHSSSKYGKKWYQMYWFKADLYIFIFSIMAAYFGTEYFFDVLGMVYNYPQVHLTFDSALVGSGKQSVPVIMYLLTMAYFMTYHVTAVIVLRRLKTSGQRWIAWLFPLAILAIGYFWAWMETYAMTNPMMKGTFYYQDMSRMLSYGSILYACFFIVSFPIFYFIDEKPGKTWSLIQTTAGALSASMLTIFLLDLITKIIGHI
jgi:cycloeucalenol cycloisomerase